jgi:hypothetical protein
MAITNLVAAVIPVTAQEEAALLVVPAVAQVYSQPHTLQADLLCFHPAAQVFLSTALLMERAVTVALQIRILLALLVRQALYTFHGREVKN